jgi:hypothetical protein
MFTCYSDENDMRPCDYGCICDKCVYSDTVELVKNELERGYNMKKWYNVELWQGYTTNNLKSYLRMNKIKYNVSDCTPLPNKGKYMLHFEVYCTEEEVQTINEMIDIWDEEEREFIK